MAFSATDVGNRIDLLLNGEGYMFSEPEQNRAQYGFTPTYVTRGNTQGDFGDNFQDFWLTATQRDWSLGDGQRYYRSSGEESISRYFTGSDIDISIPGQVNLNRRRVTGDATASAITSAWQSGRGENITFSTGTNLYSISNAGAITSHGAHGVGSTPYCGCSDGLNDYISAKTGGVTRKWNGTTFSTFSATGVDTIAYHNNALYGIASSTLYRFDSAGTATSVGSWLTADSNYRATIYNMISYGGKLLILLYQGLAEFPNGPELWIYDGAGVSKVAELGKGVEIAQDSGYQATVMCVVNGVVFVGVNVLNTSSSGGYEGRPAIWYYANGSTGYIWRSPTFQTTGAVLVAPFQGNLAFMTQWDGTLYLYNQTIGGVSKITTGSVAPFPTHFMGGLSYLVGLNSSVSNVFFGSTGNAATHYAASGTLTTSQYDFDSSLTKIFRGIKVEFESASGGTVDIAYQVDGVGGSYTTLQTGATSGTEYPIASTTGKTMSVKVTLNGSGANAGPTLKRISVRAAPLQGTFAKNTYVLALGGVDGKNGQQLRDGTFHPNDGQTQATALRSVATTATPVTIVDKFGSFTGVIENEGFQIREYRPQEYVAVVPVRQV